MDQSITLTIAGKEYPLKASSPEAEQLMRLAAEDVNSLLAKFDSLYPDRELSDKLAFVALNEAQNKLVAKRRNATAVKEITALQDDLSAYLDGIEKK